jgi:16S rRNA (cytosine967-C5)-methyltransferase
LNSASIARNQLQTFLRLWQCVLPHARVDRNLPSRLQDALRHPEFGSRDRRLYRELLYTAVRYLPWIEELAARSEAEAARAVAWLAAPAPATQGFREALLPGWPELPALISGRAQHLGVSRELLPDWFRSHCPAAFATPNLEVLHARAPLWIRLQSPDSAAVLAEFSARGWPVRWSGILPAAGEIPGEADVTSTRAHREGRFEVQDLGSQLVLASAAIAPGGRWLDACAGAGGKTLQLAGLVGPGGCVDAFDVRAGALAELRMRTRRGGFANIRVLERIPDDAAYDGVLVDAPCSGSGTWRRAPHLKWCTTAADIAAHAALQRRLLARFSRFVRPGGMLVYATCSLSRQENQDAVAAFRADHPEFASGRPVRSFGCPLDESGLSVLPAIHNTDGFFVGELLRGN